MAMDDKVNELLRTLDGVQRQIVELSLNNVSNEQIANTVKRSIRTVRRERMRFDQEIARHRTDAGSESRRIVADHAESSDSDFA